MISAGHYQRLRAPSENGGKLCVPAWDLLREQIGSNRQHLDGSTVEILGKALGELAAEARREFLAATFPQQPEAANRVSAPLVITGHQPELFHPGVWLKNFVAARLAGEVAGHGANLIIDSDLCRSPAITVLGGKIASPYLTRVPYDALASAKPYEERRIEDREVWNSFAERVSEVVAPFVASPLVQSLWPRVVELSQASDSISHVLSQARHELETEWGSGLGECRQSVLCQLDAFRRFAVHLWRRAGEFREAHNRALQEYRVAHRLRNAAQPLPDLAVQGDWIETPFWLWSRAAPQRRGLFVRSNGKRLTLSDLGTTEVEIPGGAISSETAVQDCIELLRRLEQKGVKIRTRALTTTLFTRLLIADVFIHGIGGAKYDQVTNSICTRFFCVELPQYAVVTGTLRLPLAYESPSHLSTYALQKTLRDIRFHPETLHAELTSGCNKADLAELDNITQTKRRWIETPPTPANAGERHRQINQANEQLAARLQDYRSSIESLLTDAQQTKQREKILLSREYSYCLFPAAEVGKFLLS